MKIEHFAINVKEPQAMAQWYAEHLGLTIIRADETPPFITFLADDNNQTLLELYANPNGEYIDFANLTVFTFHIAFSVPDMAGECVRLIEAGATSKGDAITLGNGDKTQFVQCPWGVTIQFLERINPLFPD
ncbi:MAG: VOC family protein [Chloroflexota bacterium]